jgi:FkbM family methyltransferase
MTMPQTSKILYQQNMKLAKNWLLSQICMFTTKRLRDKLYRLRGHPMVIFANDNIGITINQFGRFEHAELELLFDFLRPMQDSFLNGAAIDIGANIGNHSLFFSNFFSQIYAFEPNPLTHQLLSINASFKDNITTFCCGLGDSKGQFILAINPINTGGSFIISDKKKPSNQTKAINVELLDEFLTTEKPIKFIKIDTEGCEYSVLLWASRTIRKQRPVIIFEQHLDQFVNGSTSAANLLKEIGYRICWLERHFEGKNPLTKIASAMKDLAVGRTYKVKTGGLIPKRSHKMLIALPEDIYKMLSKDKS